MLRVFIEGILVLTIVCYFGYIAIVAGQFLNNLFTGKIKLTRALIITLVVLTAALILGYANRYAEVIKFKF